MWEKSFSAFGEIDIYRNNVKNIQRYLHLPIFYNQSSIQLTKNKYHKLTFNSKSSDFYEINTSCHFNCYLVKKKVLPSFLYEIFFGLKFSQIGDI